MQKLIEYNLTGTEFEQKKKGQLLTYELAGNGVFVQAEREGLNVLIPVTEGEIRGLANLCPLVRMSFPKVPACLCEFIQASAYEWARIPLESVWHLVWSPKNPCGWEVVEPDQVRGRKKCQPLESGAGSSHERAIIEIHSHHYMPAIFSKVDDDDETGFRLYGVIGEFAKPKPVMRFRVGVYGYFYEVPASAFMDCGDVWENA